MKSTKSIGIPFGRIAVATATCSIFFLAYWGAMIGCKDSGVEVQRSIPGRRDYLWKIDTVSVPGVFIRSMDGVSPNDVWGVSAAGDFRYTLFHFNGKRWSTDGLSRPLSPNAVRTLASNEAWCVGLEGDIWRFDGSQWQSANRIVVNGSTLVSLEDINGNMRNSLVAVGTYFTEGGNLNPLIAKSDGVSWSIVPIPTLPQTTFYRIEPISATEAYVLGLTHVADGSVPDTNKIFMLDGSQLTQLYASSASSRGWTDIAVSDGELLSLRGRSLSITTNGRTQEVAVFDNPSSTAALGARTPTDAILVLQDGVAHYDGDDLQYLFHYSNANIRGVGILMFPNDAFVYTHDYSNGINYVYRGHLPTID